ncbi:hypothetical protein [Parachlamydia acanthamoebae]|nr:hypothetical protein [Parachlamydia acanthamoebae]
MTKKNLIQKEILTNSFENHAFQMSMQVTLDENLEDKRLIGIIKGILNQVKTPIKDLKIQIKNPENIQFRIGEGATQKLDLALENDLPTDLRIRILSIAARALPKSGRSMKEIRQELLKTWPNRVPIIKLFWGIAILPLCALMHILSLRKYDLGDLDIATNPEHEKSLLTLLEWSKHALDLKKETDSLLSLGEEFTMANQFEEAIQIGKLLQGDTSKATLAQKYAHNIVDRFKKIEERPDAINLMLIPTGYWKKKTFQPVLLAFYRNAEGKLGLTEFTYGKKNKDARDFVWDKEINADEFSKFLAPLLGLEEKVKTSAPSKNIARAAYLQMGAVNLRENAMQNMAEQGIQGAASFIPGVLEESGSNQAFREQIWVSSGATFVPSRAEKRGKIRTSPDKIIHEMIRLQFGDSAAADKATFTLAILNDRLEKVIKALPQMRLEDKLKWLKLLEQDQKRLERQLAKSSGNPQFKELVLDPASPFSAFSKRIHDLKIELAKLDKMQASYHKKRAGILNKVKNFPIRLEIPLKLQTKQKRKEEIQIQISEADLKLIEDIKAGFTNPTVDNVRETTKQLLALGERLDQLVDEKKYTATIELYRSIIPYIPSPISKDPLQPVTIYDLLLQKAIQEGKSELLDQFSASLEKLTHYSWEARVKSRDLPLTSSEWVHTINHQAVLYTSHN